MIIDMATSCIKTIEFYVSNDVEICESHWKITISILDNKDNIQTLFINSKKMNCKENCKTQLVHMSSTVNKDVTTTQ